MATGAYKGDVFTLQDSPKVATLPRAALAGGRVYSTMDRVTTTAVLGVEDPTTVHVAKLPKNAVVLYSIVYPILAATYDTPDATANTITGVLGITGDTNLFGAVTALDAATTRPQIVVPIPDGVTYTDRLDPLEEAVDVFFTSADADFTATEGIVVQMFYTIAGQI